MASRASRIAVIGMAFFGALVVTPPVSTAAAPPLARITEQRGCNPQATSASAYWVRFYVYNDRPNTETAISASVESATVNDANYSPRSGEATGLANRQIAAGGTVLQTSSFGQYVTAHLSVTLRWADGKTITLTASAKPVAHCVRPEVPALTMVPLPTPGRVHMSRHRDVVPVERHPSGSAVIAPSITVSRAPPHETPPRVLRSSGSSDWVDGGLVVLAIGFFAAVTWLSGAILWGLPILGRRREEEDDKEEPAS